MKQKIIFIVSLLIVFYSVSAIAENIRLKADCRQRPPEMMYDKKTRTCSGPLIDILNLAVKDVGAKIKWARRPFQKSYTLLQRGRIDILPRVIKTKERLEDVKYFSAIGYQVKNILFAVKKGHENDIQKFQDLKKYRICTKRGTAYFDQYNDDTSINKVNSIDDSDLTRKFLRSRCDAAIILDIKAFEKVMKSMKSDDYAYAKYQYENKIGNHFAMSLKSKHIQLFDKIDNTLKKICDSGKINEIYQKYNIAPPLTDKLTK
jgi:polar amino acid transport system substrate-binding protein